MGEKIDHVDGMTIEEAEHQLATRLYQNTAKVHFNQLRPSRALQRRLIYGGHIISLARCLSFNGLGERLQMLAINAGAHANPSFAGDTIYAYSEVLEKLSCRDAATSASPAGAPGRDQEPSGTDFPYKKDGKYDDAWCSISTHPGAAALSSGRGPAASTSSRPRISDQVGSGWAQYGSSVGIIGGPHRRRTLSCRVPAGVGRHGRALCRRARPDQAQGRDRVAPSKS